MFTATSAQDGVLKHNEVKAQEKQAQNKDEAQVRKGWGAKPSSTVLNLLKAAGR